MRSLCHAALLALVICAAACAGTPEDEPRLVFPIVAKDATEVDLLALVGEFRQIRPGTPVGRLARALPEFRRAVTNSEAAGLLVSDDGVAVVVEIEQQLVSLVWIEFLGTDRIPASPLTSKDGLLRAGATEDDVLTYLSNYELPVVIASYPADEAEDGVAVTEYYVDAVRTWVTVQDGRLARILSAAPYIYDQGRSRAVTMSVGVER